MNCYKIIKAIDELLELRGVWSVDPVEANSYLERKGLLNDSQSRPGLPLRKLLRAGEIPHAYQDGRYWRIPHSEHKNQCAKVVTVQDCVDGAVALDPVADQKSRILILGSMPGKESLEKQEYYSDTRNRFWKILSALYKEEIPQEYRGRISFLTGKNIALWDVYLSASRRGSLDTNIVSGSFNDIIGFLNRFPNIDVIVLNGAKAADAFERYVEKTKFNPGREIC